MSFAPETEPLADPKSLLRVPVGLVSPLWPLFAGVAVSGAAWWWMTRWAQPENLEAMFGAAAKAETDTAAGALALAEPAAEAIEAAAKPLEEADDAFEAAAEPVVEAAIEADAKVEAFIAESIAETVVAEELLVETSPFEEPIGGESAPISPVVAAMTPQVVEEAIAEAGEAGLDVAPKPKKKPAAFKAD
jgi:hypothetical protein